MPTLRLTDQESTGKSAGKQNSSPNSSSGLKYSTFLFSACLLTYEEEEKLIHFETTPYEYESVVKLCRQLYLVNLMRLSILNKS